MNSDNKILIGLDSKNHKIFIENDYRQILLLAPHGSGKGVAFVIPNLLTYAESAILHDIKLENHMLTSDYRKSIGHEVFLFEPLNAHKKTHCYNPLDFLGKGLDERLVNCQKLARLLINCDECGSEGARKLFTALVCYLFASDKKVKTFGAIARMLLQDDFVKELSEELDKVKAKMPQFAYDKLVHFLKEQDTQSHIVYKLARYLSPWHNPFVDHATSKSDFDIADLKTRKISIYVGLQPADIQFLAPVLRLFYEHAVDRLMYTAIELGHGDKNKGVTFFLDEFYTLGNMSFVYSSLPYLRGYRIRLALIASNLQQVKKAYGKFDTRDLVSSCDYKIIFGAHEDKTAQKVSKLCVGSSFTQEEVMALRNDEQLILQAGEKTIKTKKFKYFEDKDMVKLVTK